MIIIDGFQPNPEYFVADLLRLFQIYQEIFFPLSFSPSLILSGHEFAAAYQSNCLLLLCILVCDHWLVDRANMHSSCGVGHEPVDRSSMRVSWSQQEQEWPRLMGGQIWPPPSRPSPAYLPGLNGILSCVLSFPVSDECASQILSLTDPDFHLHVGGLLNPIPGKLFGTLLVLCWIFWRRSLPEKISAKADSHINMHKSENITQLCFLSFYLFIFQTLHLKPQTSWNKFLRVSVTLLLLSHLFITSFFLIPLSHF